MFVPLKNKRIEFTSKADINVLGKLYANVKSLNLRKLPSYNHLEVALSPLPGLPHHLCMGSRASVFPGTHLFSKAHAAVLLGVSLPSARLPRALPSNK